MPIFEVEAQGRRFEIEAPSLDAATAAIRGGEQAAPQAPEAPQPGWGQWARDLVTGELRTEFPDAPEFGAAMGQRMSSAGPLQHLTARGLSAVTPDPAAQVDIIRRTIPDVEQKTDKHGNIMLRAPSAGVNDWAYLNKPGASWRDAAEFTAGTVASLPFAPLFGAGAAIPARLATGALAGVGGSVAQDVAATAMGSDQGIDPTRAAVSGVVGGALGPLAGRAQRAAPGAASRPGTVADDVAPQPAPAGGPPGAVRDDLGLPEPVAPPVAQATDPAGPPVWTPGDRTPRQVVTPDGSMTVQAVPEVVELNQLRLASGDLQPRDRVGRSEYTQGSRERATNLDPERLLPSRVSDSGAPLVLPDGTIISGNGRVMSLGEVYANTGLDKQAAAYRARLGTQAAGMQKPVLVMRMGPMSREDAARFADLSNRPAVAAMSVTERAARDARALGDDALALYQGGDFEAPQNAQFLRAFMERAVTSAERAGVSNNNRLTREGVDRMRAAVLASAYDDPAVIGRMLESIDDNLRNITNALVDAAPKMSQLRADVRAGLVPAEMNASGMLSEAVRLIGDLRNRGITPERYFAQQDAFKTTDPMADAWVRAFYSDDLAQPLSRQKMAAVLNAYADEARLHRTGGLFPDETTPGDVLTAARKVARNAETEGEAVGVNAGAGARVPESGQPAPGPAPPPGGRGPASGGGQAGDSREAFDNAAAASLGPRERVARRGDEPVNRYLERTADDEPRISRDPSRSEIADAASRQGLEVPNVVARGAMARKLGAGLSATFVGSPLRQASDKAAKGIGVRAQEVAGQFSDLSERSAGEVARKALAEWIGTDGRGSEVVQSLFDRVRRQFKGKETRLNPLAETQRIFNDLSERQAAAASKLNEPALKLVREALERPGGLTFQGLADLRTQIGHMIDGSIMPAPGTPMPALKRIYGALSEDMRHAAHRLGGDPAVKLLDRAIDVSAMVAERRAVLASIVGAKGDEAPEVVVARLVRLADGRAGKGDAASLLRARRVLGEDWNAVAGAAIRQLGQKGDTFSVQQFLTRYENLSPNGRQILFRSSGKDNLADALHDLATLSRRFDDLQKAGNPSGTGNVATLLGLGAGLIHNPLYAFGGLGGGWLMARMLASPLAAKQTSRWANAYLVNATAPTRASMASLNIATQMLARTMSQEGIGNEDDITRQLEAALQGGGDGSAR